MTFAAISHFDDIADEFEEAMQFEKIRRNQEGAMPVASSLAACRAAHRRKSRRARHRGLRTRQRHAR